MEIVEEALAGAHRLELHYAAGKVLPVYLVNPETAAGQRNERRQQYVFHIGSC
jgi:hypothetical protein